METLTVPAHIEDGAVRLDAPLPPGAVSVEVRVRIGQSEARPLSLSEYVRSLPPGTKAGAQIDAEMLEIRNWDR